MTIFTEITPNPATLKFVVEGQTFLNKGTADFPNLEAVGDRSLLATRLFEFKFVAGVMIGYNFITITKDPAFKWEEMIPKVKELIRDHIASGQIVVLPLEESAEDLLSASEDSDIVKKIKGLLDDNIRPAVAMDGGDITFESFENGVVKLKMKGSCAGCPSSTMTLKMGIEGMLTRFIPEVKTVEAV